MIQKNSAEVLIYKGLDPTAPASAPLVKVPASPKTFRRTEGLVAADLDGDGVESLLVLVPDEGRLVALDPLEGDAVDVRDLWEFRALPFSPPDTAGGLRRGR